MDMALKLRGRGRPEKEVEVAVIGPLTEGDIHALTEAKSAPGAVLGKLRSRHHALAKALAGGMSQVNAAILTGMVPENVYRLGRDPTFKELVKFYEGEVSAQYADLHESLAGLSYDAAEELRRRLEEDPEELGTGTLVEMVKMGADRTGHGPASSTTQVNVNLNLATRLESARRRVDEARRASGLLIEHQEAAE